MSTPTTCPRCEASMQGNPIPDEHRQHKANCPLNGGAEHCFCRPWGDETHFSRVIGHEVPGVYDGTLYWSCPDCGHAWPRFTDGLGRLTESSARYAVEHNARAAS